MAINIQAQVSKKLPIPRADFSSQQASITITAEISDLSHVSSEARRLFALAEHAVDQQLAGASPATSTFTHQSAEHSRSSATTPPELSMRSPGGPPSTSTASHGPAQGPASASRPFRQTTPRRGPAPITDSQLRYIDKLLAETNTPLAAILDRFQIAGLAALTCKEGAGLIDELKAGSPR